MNLKNFFAELKRRNVYKVAVAYAVVAWLLLQGASIILPSFEAPAWTIKVLIIALAVGLPIAVVLAWAFEITPEGIVRAEDVIPGRSITRKTGNRLTVLIVAVMALAIALLVFQIYRGKQSTGLAAGTAKAARAASSEEGKSIAVLPFVDMSQAKDQEYFCDGISEELLDALAKVEGLRVVARTSSFSFKGKSADVSEVAKKLNVDNVLEGSLRRSGDRIRVTTQLINARSGFHLWSETYERELKDVFAVQDEITRAIVDALKVKLAVTAPVRPQPNSEAYDLYLQGLFFANKSDEQNLRKALALYQQAVEKDPTSSRGWTGIAQAWLWLADAYVKPLEAYPVVKASAQKAISLDDRNADAHCYLGEALRILDWDILGEERELKRALEIDRNSAPAHMFSATLKICRGDWKGAVTESELAVKLDPLSPVTAGSAAVPYVRAGRTKEAIAAALRVSELDPSYLYRDPVLGMVYFESGRYEEAAALFEKAQDVTHSPSPSLASTYARLGRTDDAKRTLSQILEYARNNYIAGGAVAAVYATLGDKDDAFRWLERGYAEHDGLQFIAFDPIFRPLHSDPRFADLLKRIGFDPSEVLARDKAL